MNRLEKLIDELKEERTRQIERLYDFFRVHSYHTYPPTEPHVKYVLLQRIITDLEDVLSEFEKKGEE